jgi:hypothetical protein
MTSIQTVKALKGVLREHLDWNGARRVQTRFVATRITNINNGLDAKRS